MSRVSIQEKEKLPTVSAQQRYQDVCKIFVCKIYEALYPYLSQVRALMEQFFDRCEAFSQEHADWKARQQEYFEKTAISNPKLLDPGNPVMENDREMRWNGRQRNNFAGPLPNGIESISSDEDLRTPYVYERFIQAEELTELRKTSSPLLQYLMPWNGASLLPAGEEAKVVIEAWAPRELHNENEPEFDYPLPPRQYKRKLENCELVAGLVAFHDYHTQGRRLFPTAEVEEATYCQREIIFMIMRAEAQFWGVDEDRILEMDRWLQDVVSEIELNSQGGSAKNKSQPEDNEPEVEFIFAPDGDGFFIRAFGEEGHFKFLKGFEYLYRLVQQTDRGLLATELHNTRVTDISNQPLIDEEGLKEIRNRKTEAEQELEQARHDSDSVAELIAIEELEHAKKYIRQVTSPNGKVKNVSKSSTSAITSVSSCIDRAIDKLRNVATPMTKLADHFERSITCVLTVAYSPENKTIRWSTCRPKVTKTQE
ncbi:hypothetical protein [Bythopirellula polymerisocia]|uniref:Uncharacterized protein n=1 Tax=Bythopirellula polymerisocia TaxID=2528003 RepID=A0A5C6CET7_9BACT|nr:hypothetical protein [Bythopirellula polymerisocia]TWU21816.1 hypothetical protein Pla144_45120 [Bythopirellula polymerisocia]